MYEKEKGIISEKDRIKDEVQERDKEKMDKDRYMTS